MIKDRVYGKKIVAVILAMTIAMLPLCSCAKDGQANDELLGLTKDGIKYILDRKISKLSKISTSDFDDVKKKWADELDFSAGSSWTNEECIVLSAISDTIEYSIDEDSVDSSLKYNEGKVRVDFTMADYTELFEDEEAMNDADSFADSLSSCDEKTIEIWFNFEKEGDAWLIANCEEILNALYSFREERFTFVPDLTRASHGLDWYGTDSFGGTSYSNPFDISCVLYFYDNSDTSQVYYTVSYDGNVIYVSSPGMTQGNFCTTDPGAPLDPSRGTLAPGQYTISFYDGCGRLIDEDTCTVYTMESSPADDILWYSEDEDWGSFALYDTTYVIDPDLNLNNLNNYSSTNYYYTVTFEGDLVYTSAQGEYMGYYYADYQDPDSWELLPGLYQIDFYDCTNDALVASAYAIVMLDGAGPDGTYLGAFLGHNIIGRNISYTMQQDLLSAYWYSGDTSNSAQSGIISGASTLTYRIPVTQDYGTLLFDFTYSDDGDADDPFAYGLSSTNSAEVQVDADGSMYYEFTYSGTVNPGYYRITILADNAVDFTSFSVCQVQ